MSKLIIHRGTQEIGGSAVEINNGETRLLFDFGVPLDSMVKDEWKPQDYKLPIFNSFAARYLPLPAIMVLLSSTRIGFTNPNCLRLFAI